MKKRDKMTLPALAAAPRQSSLVVPRPASHPAPCPPAALGHVAKPRSVPPVVPLRSHLGTLRAQLTGRCFYMDAKLSLGARCTLSRTNSAALDCRKFDCNAIAVVNSVGKTVGSLARGFAKLVAPVLDGSLAELECTVPLKQHTGGSMDKQFNPGEQFDLDIDFFASAAQLPGLKELGILAHLGKVGGAAAATPSSTPAAATKRAREPEADSSDGCYTNLKSTAGGVFTCFIVVDGREELHKVDIRFPDAWLKKELAAGGLGWADEVIMCRSSRHTGGLVEVFRKDLRGEEKGAKKEKRAKKLAGIF